ncbi:MAG: sensor histidine kinase [Flavobacteriales bacterium]|nr:sensor histidine kinase [Flavobacteriales bacterium]
MTFNLKKVFSYTPILVAILSAFFVYWLLGIYGKAELKGEKRASEEILHRELDQNRSIIEQKIIGQKDVAKSLAEYVAFNPKIDQIIFANWAKRVFLKSNSQALAFTITRKQEINLEYPKGSGDLISLTLKSPPIESKEGNSVLSYFKKELLNGSPAVVHQNFIYITDTTSGELKYWGSAVIVDDLEKIIELVPFKSNHDRNFNLAVDSEEGEQILRVGNPFGENDLFVSEFFKLQLLTIKLSLGNAMLSVGLEKKTKDLKILFISIAILIAALNGYLLANMFNIQRKNKILAFKNGQIKVQLGEKILLIKEIHHRIKNHFQLISSLNRTSADRLRDKTVEEIVESINNRIELMAKAYDQISGGSKANNYMPDYIPSVVKSLIYGAEPPVHDFYEITKLEINIKRTVYIGIILNELVMNSIKHSFPENKQDNLLKIEFRTIEDRFVMKYLANGVSLPKDVFREKKNSTGIQVLTLFTEQLEGNIIQIEDNGLHGYKIEFPI